MANLFPHIGIIGKPRNLEVQSTLASLVQFLQQDQYAISLELECAEILSEKHNTLPKAKLAEHCDLIIVVGGDGIFLDAARAVVDWKKPMVGINRGRLGFLTDINPQAFKQYLIPLLKGEYQMEKRFLLDMQLKRNQVVHQCSALNDVVLYSGDVARMIEFEVYINHKFVYRLRSDGLIVATPTGSTAYALSGGGPILNPSLDAFVLVPMHPHTLTSRPIVLDARDDIELLVCSDNNNIHPRVSCDGQVNFNVKANDRILISRKKQELNLLHPIDYDYYHTLRTKLNWSSQ